MIINEVGRIYFLSYLNSSISRVFLIINEFRDYVIRCEQIFLKYSVYMIL